MARITHFLVALFLGPPFLTGCTGSASSRGSCELVNGKPFPEKGAVRYEATFNVTGPGIEAVLIVDANEADRAVLPVGEEQKITLKSTGLAPGEHRFELRSVTKDGGHKHQTGVFIVQ